MTIKASLAICFLALANPATGDHFPEDLRASDPPDRMLAGVAVAPDPTAELAGAIRSLGPPMDYRERQTETSPVRGGEASYRWRRGGAEIQIDTMWHFDDQGRRVETVVSCSISGSKSEVPFCSARGVCLGDSVAVVEQHYGKKYLRDGASGHDSIRYQFKDGTDLDFGLGKDGLVTQVRLAASAE